MVYVLNLHSRLTKTYHILLFIIRLKYNKTTDGKFLDYLYFIYTEISNIKIEKPLFGND